MNGIREIYKINQIPDYIDNGRASLSKFVSLDFSFELDSFLVYWMGELRS